jgi:cysteine desulfurase / selenocysteine lyase
VSTPSAISVQTPRISIEELPELLVGANTVVPTMHGPMRYINFDNAASTPTFRPIAESVLEFLKWYSNVHRGQGFKSQLSSWTFERSRDRVAEFVGADLSNHVVIFTKNSTEAINKLAHRYPFRSDGIILTTIMEHHSNELPWRRAGHVEHIAVEDDGTVSKGDFLNKMNRYGSRVQLVAITGASNVTGYINDLDFFAREAHRNGAEILVDGAQLVPHRPVTMKPRDKEHRIDYLVFSGHKVYAPFGVGVLVAQKKIFEQGPPETVGGGVVDMVTLEDAYWTDLPDKEEAGTPDITGVVALGKAIELLESVGWDNIIRHESELTEYALNKLKKIPNITIYGDTNPSNAANRLGVISFNFRGIHHSLVSAILSYEGGIGVRSGCFCAHMYVQSLLKCEDEKQKVIQQKILARDRSDIPGTVRISFGIYNTISEIDRLIEMLQKIAAGDYSKDYIVDREKGEYYPTKFSVDFSQYFAS